MASKKDKQTKLKEEKEEFIIDVNKQDIKPKTTQHEESKFIAETMKLTKGRKKETRKVKEEKKEKKVKKVSKVLKVHETQSVSEPRKSKGFSKEPINVEKEAKPTENKEELVKHIKEVEHDIKKDIEVRKIVKPTIPYKGIKKTADLLGQGFHYFVDFEYKLTHDFLFGYLPEKIKKYIKLIIPLLLMILFLKTPFDLDPQIKKALGLFIFISLLWALESISIIVTALSIPVLAVMLGLVNTSNPFSSFSNPIIYLLRLSSLCF